MREKSGIALRSLVLSHAKVKVPLRSTASSCELSEWNERSFQHAHLEHEGGRKRRLSHSNGNKETEEDEEEAHAGVGARLANGTTGVPSAKIPRKPQQIRFYAIVSSRVAAACSVPGTSVNIPLKCRCRKKLSGNLICAIRAIAHTHRNVEGIYM